MFFSKTSKLKFKWENVRANVDNALKHMLFYKIIFSVVKVMQENGKMFLDSN